MAVTKTAERLKEQKKTGSTTSKTRVPSGRKKKEENIIPVAEVPPAEIPAAPAIDRSKYPPVNPVVPFVPQFPRGNSAPIVPVSTTPNVPEAPTSPSAPTAINPAPVMPGSSDVQGWLSHPITQTFTTFNASSYLPSNLFTPSSALPRTNDADFQQGMQAIKEQTNSAKLAQENLKLTTEVFKAEGLSIKAMQQIGLNMIEGEKLRGIGVDFQTQQVNTQIKEVRLQGAQLDLKGEQQSLKRAEQMWQLKIEGMDTEIAKVSALLSNKKAELAAIPVQALPAQPAARPLAPAA